MTPDIWLVVLCTFGLLVALGATTGVVNELLWVSEPLACALAGVALGPAGFGLLHLDPAANPLHAEILREAARITLAIGSCQASGRSARSALAETPADRSSDTAPSTSVSRSRGR